MIKFIQMKRLSVTAFMPPKMLLVMIAMCFVKWSMCFTRRSTHHGSLTSCIPANWSCECPECGYVDVFGRIVVGLALNKRRIAGCGVAMLEDAQY
jgi:hypothetical protein